MSKAVLAWAALTGYPAGGFSPGKSKVKGPAWLGCTEASLPALQTAGFSLSSSSRDRALVSLSLLIGAPTLLD